MGFRVAARRLEARNSSGESTRKSGVSAANAFRELPPPGHGGHGYACFSGDADVAYFVADVKHVGGGLRKSFADGAQMLGLE
jgi:hypothetical protein